MCAPGSANARAIARPMPRPPPVTTTVLLIVLVVVACRVWYREYSSR